MSSTLDARRTNLGMFKNHNEKLNFRKDESDNRYIAFAIDINMFFLHSAGWIDLIQWGQGQRFHRHRTHPGPSPLHLQYGVSFMMMIGTVFTFLGRTFKIFIQCHRLIL